MPTQATYIASTDQEGEAISRVTPLTRELAARVTDGIHVLLLWHPREDTVTVAVEDSRAGARFAVEVPRAHALDAFYHPFAYAA
jgi:hypothetical protein